MKVETIIYVFMALCIAMILFNCAQIFLNKRKLKRLSNGDKDMEGRIREQIANLRKGQPIDEKHVKWIEKKLRRIGNLLAFEAVIDTIKKDDNEGADMYLKHNYEVFINLTQYYVTRESEEATFFAYMINKYKIAFGENAKFFAKEMMILLNVHNMYCRENALSVIYSTEDEEIVIKALMKLDKNSNVFHHSKLIHDGLLDYPGDKEKLQQAILEHLDDFSPKLQAPLIQYLRMSGAQCSEEMFRIMMDSSYDDEVRFSCMRYFGKFYYEPAYPVLIDFLQNKKDRRWEYPTIAATVLQNYKSERTINVLTEALHDSNWYVRSNAAESLAKLGMKYIDLVEVFEGKDRFAREILQYWIDYVKEPEEEPEQVLESK